MPRQKKLKIPKSAIIKCPHCRKSQRMQIPQDSCLYFYNCKKCDQKLETPTAQCCVVCAYTKKECAPVLIRKFEKQNR